METKGYVYIKQNPVFHLGEREKLACMADFSRFKEQLLNREHIFCREILGKQMQIFLLDLWNIYACEINRQADQQHESQPLQPLHGFGAATRDGKQGSDFL